LSGLFQASSTEPCDNMVIDKSLAVGLWIFAFPPLPPPRSPLHLHMVSTVGKPHVLPLTY
jgi:hypothetical protein